MVKHWSVEIGDEKPGETRIRRNHMTPNELLTSPHEDIKTIYDLVQFAAKNYGDRNAIGSRPVIDIVEEEKEIKKVVQGKEVVEKKTWKYFQLGSYKWATYKDHAENVSVWGSALHNLGITKSDRVSVYAATSAYWLTAAHAVFHIGSTIVTAYDTLGEEGLTHSLNESEVVAIFTNANLLSTMVKVLHQCAGIKLIVYNEKASDSVLEKLKTEYPHITVLNEEEFVAKGKAKLVEANPPAADDYACIMYTSGSTGAPKGVLITHKMLVAGLAGIDKGFGHLFTKNDSVLVYLPLAHVFEFVLEHTAIYWGIAMGYGSPKTLTDASVRNCQGDIKELKPTLLAGVPAVWELIRKGIIHKVNSGPSPIKSLFWGAVRGKLTAKKFGLPTFPFDLIFRRVKEQTGGRLRFAISGGAPLAHETQEFLSTILCPVLIGYGMTECCATLAIQPVEAKQLGNTGPPLGNVEVKLVDVPDAGYFSTNSPKPQGEIWIRGDNVFKGYYKRDKETAESLSEDGWLMTGDIGEWNTDGSLSIIDRKKNLVKLQGGEYIAIEKLESIYKSTIYIANIMVYADSSKTKPIALVYPAENTIRNLAKQNGITDEDLEELCKNEKLNNLVLKEINATGKKAGLSNMELLYGIRLVPDEWTPQNGLTTAAQKLNRKVLQTKYEQEIKQAYA